MLHRAAKGRLVELLLLLSVELDSKLGMPLKRVALVESMECKICMGNLKWTCPSTSRKCTTL